MRLFWDEIAKSFLQEILEPAGKPETEHRIVAHEAQFADVWFEPEPGGEENRKRLGWLGKMSEKACIFEPFSNIPRMDDVRECLRKLLGKHHHRSMDMKKKGHKSADMPWLWIIAPSLPPGIQQAFVFRASSHWPAGIWLSPKGIQLGWVSLSELPRTRDTLMLRLILVRGRVYEQAREELDGLPDDAWEKWTANCFVFAKIQRLLEDRQSGRRELSREEKEFLMNSQQRYAMLEKQILERGRQEGFLLGRQEGREETLRSVLLQIYESRFGRVPARIVKALQNEHAPDRLLAWTSVFSMQSHTEIDRALGFNGL